jgi:hypothetical protein
MCSSWPRYSSSARAAASRLAKARGQAGEHGAEASEGLRPERERFAAVQHQAMRWTFLGPAMRNDGFLSALGEVSPAGRARIEEVAPAFC